METAIAPPKIRRVFYLHLPPDYVKVAPTPIDRNRFTAVGEGFDDFSMVEGVSYFGVKPILLDISGNTRQSIKEHLKKAYGSLVVDHFRFLQALEYLKEFKGESPVYERIVAYTGRESPPVAVVRDGDRFNRVPVPDPEEPWPDGTLGLFFLDEL